MLKQPIINFHSIRGGESAKKSHNVTFSPETMTSNSDLRGFFFFLYGPRTGSHFSIIVYFNQVIRHFLPQTTLRKWKCRRILSRQCERKSSAFDSIVDEDKLERFHSLAICATKDLSLNSPNGGRMHTLLAWMTRDMKRGGRTVALRVPQTLSLKTQFIKTRGLFY